MLRGSLRLAAHPAGPPPTFHLIDTTMMYAPRSGGVKRYLTANFATMVMALLLAMLTWIYLFTQGNGPGEVEVQFLPRLDLKDFASVSYEDEGGHEKGHVQNRIRIHIHVGHTAVFHCGASVLCSASGVCMKCV